MKKVQDKKANENMEAPGQLLKHYAPYLPCYFTTNTKFDECEYITHLEEVNAQMPAKDNAVDGTNAKPDEARVLNFPCPCCGGRMVIIEAFAAGMEPKHRPIPEAIDSS